MNEITASKIGCVRWGGDIFEYCLIGLKSLNKNINDNRYHNI